MKISAPQRLLWSQFDALQMGSGWDEEDIKKPQILLEDVFGDSHPRCTAPLLDADASETERIEEILRRASILWE